MALEDQRILVTIDDVLHARVVMALSYCVGRLEQMDEETVPPWVSNVMYDVYRQGEEESRGLRRRVQTRG